MPSKKEVSYIECKTYGHAWDEYNPRDGMKTGFYDRLTLRCVRCTTTRHDYFDAGGVIESRRYAYPDGYKWANKKAMLSRAVLRLLVTNHQWKG